MPPKKKLIVRNPGKPIAYKTNPKSGMVEKAKPKKKLIVRKKLFSPEFYEVSPIPKTENEIDMLGAERKKIYKSEMKSLKEKYKTKANLLKAPSVLALKPVQLKMIKKATKDDAFSIVLNILPSASLKKVDKEIDELQKKLKTLRSKARPEKKGIRF